jgi:rod shape-determining protein MreD
MRRPRLAAAIAAIITALLLQASVIGPATLPLAVSLPAVLVAAVALVDGPASGMSFGFATGLIADLGSQHPAGVLAICWLGVGVVCGALADRRSLGRDALVVGIVCALAAVTATVLLVVVRSAGSIADAVKYAAPTGLGDAVLAIAVVALVRRMLRTDRLRAPHAVYTELVLGPRRG